MRFQRVLIAGVIAGVVVACADAVTDDAGRAMQDAGDAMGDAGRALAGMGGDAAAGMGAVLADAGDGLRDAGAALVDAGEDAGEAQAAEPVILEAECDIASGRRVVQPDDSWTETISYFASVNADAGAYAENYAGVVALLCSWNDASPSLGAPECDGDVDCVETGDYPRPAADCKQTAEIEIGDGGKLTVQCGVEHDSSSGLPSGGRWRSVRFVLPVRD